MERVGCTQHGQAGYGILKHDRLGTLFNPIVQEGDAS